MLSTWVRKKLVTYSSFQKSMSYNGNFLCLGLSKWVRNKLVTYSSFQESMDTLETFTENRLKDMPKIE